MSQVRVLVVDDSAIYRMIIANSLNSAENVVIVGRCKDGKEAIEAIRRDKPDLVTLDVEMPIMDGLATLREIRSLSKSEDVFRHVKVVLLSALTKKGTDITIQGLNEGALDCIPKPEEGDVDRNREVLSEHLKKAVEVVRAQLAPSATPTNTVQVAKPISPSYSAPIINSTPTPSKAFSFTGQKPEVIVIGVSTGGPAALSAMLPDLCKVTRLPILIVQHMPAGFTKSLAESLAKKCNRNTVEATAGEVILPETIYIAPGGIHMLVGKNAHPIIELNDGPAENGCRPAVDVMFRSVAKIYGSKALAIILTGMGSDGTLGAKVLKQNGVPLIVQNKETSVVWGMPGSAVEAGIADEVLPLLAIPEAVAKILR